MINTNKKPFCPEGWKVESHIKNGKVELKDIELWSTHKQENGIVGTELQKLVPNPLNANVLDYLLENPILIPEEWKGKWVFFWGTIYRSSSGCLYVRCLYWGGSRWFWDCIWLDHSFDGDNPAAVLASPKSSETKPSLDTLKKGISLTEADVIPNETSLEQAIKVCKDNGLRVYREL